MSMSSRYIIRRMFRLRSGKIGTFINFLNIRVAGLSPKQRPKKLVHGSLPFEPEVFSVLLIYRYCKIYIAKVLHM